MSSLMKTKPGLLPVVMPAPLAHDAMCVMDVPPVTAERPSQTPGANGRIYTKPSREQLRPPIIPPPEPDTWRYEALQQRQSQTLDLGLALGDGSSGLRRPLTSSFNSVFSYNNNNNNNNNSSGRSSGNGRRAQTAAPGYRRTLSVPDNLIMGDDFGSRSRYGNNDAKAVVKRTGRFSAAGSWREVELPNVSREKSTVQRSARRRVGTGRFLGKSPSASSLGFDPSTTFASTHGGGGGGEAFESTFRSSTTAADTAMGRTMTSTMRSTTMRLLTSTTFGSSDTKSRRERTPSAVESRQAVRQGELARSRHLKQEYTHRTDRLQQPYAMAGNPMRLLPKFVLEQEELLLMDDLVLGAAPALYKAQSLDNSEARPPRLRDLELKRRQAEASARAAEEEEEARDRAITDARIAEAKAAAAAEAADAAAAAASTEPEPEPEPGFSLASETRARRRRSSQAYMTLMAKGATQGADVQAYDCTHLTKPSVEVAATAVVVGEATAKTDKEKEEEPEEEEEEEKKQEEGGQLATPPAAVTNPGPRRSGLIRLVHHGADGEKLSSEEYEALDRLEQRMIDAPSRALQSSSTTTMMAPLADPTTAAHTAEEVREYKELFLLLDDDGSGSVEEDELAVLLAAAFGLDHSAVGLAQAIVNMVAGERGQLTGAIRYDDFVLHIPFFIRLHNLLISSPTLIESDTTDYSLVIEQLIAETGQEHAA
eukprot:UC1_evm2s1645